MKPLKDFITKEQYDNCRKIIDFMRTKVNPSEFNMSRIIHVCGSPSCMLGYMPYALEQSLDLPDSLFPIKQFRDFAVEKIGYNKVEESERDGYGAAWYFLFGAEWVKIDNSPTGAGDRLEIALELGVPDGFSKESNDNFFSYRVDLAPYKLQLEEIRKERLYQETKQLIAKYEIENNKNYENNINERQLEETR